MKKLFLLFFFFMHYALAMEKVEKWSTYHHNSNQQFRSGLKDLEKQNVPDDFSGTFLELGCATANIAAAFAEQYPNAHVIGVEPEKHLINTARDAHGNKVHLICAGAENFTLGEDRKADLVAFYSVLHWIDPSLHQQVFTNIYENMAEGGTLRVRTSVKRDAKNPDPLLRAFLQTALSHKWWNSHFKSLFAGKAERLECDFLENDPNTFTEDQKMVLGSLLKKDSHTSLTIDQLREYAANAQFEVVSCKQQTHINEYESREVFTPWVKNAVRALELKDMLGEKNESAWIEDGVTEYYLKQTEQKEGPITYSREKILLVAQKSNKQ